MRNNNPGNIIKSEITWAGEVECADPKFECFESKEFGILAMVRLITVYEKAHGINTLSGIVARWAPSTENNTVAYLQWMQSFTKLPLNEPLDLTDHATMFIIVAGICIYENKVPPTETPMELFQIVRLAMAVVNGKG